MPVALGLYLAWVHRDRPAQSKAAGLAAAATGALAGAWLGFHAAADIVALVTAIAGAIAGGNLALILLDMTRSHAPGHHPAATKTVESVGEAAAPTAA